MNWADSFIYSPGHLFIFSFIYQAFIKHRVCPALLGTGDIEINPIRNVDTIPVFKNLTALSQAGEVNTRNISYSTFGTEW